MAVVTERRSKAFSRKLDYAKTVIIFVGPAILFYLIFIMYPVFKSFYYSFYKVTFMGMKVTSEFIGLNNFAEVLKDKVFWKAAGNTLVWAFSSPWLEIPMGFALALIIKNTRSFSNFFRTAWFMPVLLPQIVVGIIWAWIYNFDWGLLNHFFRLIGLESVARPWLGDPLTALPALIVVTTWIQTGFNMVILLAAVSSIPVELMEAAFIDGAKRIQVIFRIIIPLIKTTIVNLMILSFIGKMKVFDLIMATTQGGPMWATETVATYTVKRAFFWNTMDKGYPSAMVTMWFIIILSVSIATTYATQRKDALD